MAEVITSDDAEVAAARAIEVLHGGGLVVAPTDTVYAVVCDAFQTDATQRLMAAKGRGRQVPISLLLRNPRQVIGLAGEIPESAERLMASYWPGPVALVLEEQPHMPWDLGHTDGAITIRMPADDLLLAIAADVGPLATSAANRRNEPVPMTVDDAQAQFGEAVDLYIDGGRSAAATLTTIVDCTGDDAQVLREGLVSRGDISRVVSGDVGWGQQPDLAAPASMAVDPAAPSHHEDEET